MGAIYKQQEVSSELIPQDNNLNDFNKKKITGNNNGADFFNGTNYENINKQELGMVKMAEETIFCKTYGNKLTETPDNVNDFFTASNYENLLKCQSEIQESKTNIDCYS